MRRALWTLARAHAAEALSRVQDAIGEWRVRHGLLTPYEREQWECLERILAEATAPRLTSRHLGEVHDTGSRITRQATLPRGQRRAPSCLVAPRSRARGRRDRASVDRRGAARPRRDRDHARDGGPVTALCHVTGLDPLTLVYAAMLAGLLLVGVAFVVHVAVSKGTEEGEDWDRKHRR